MMRSVNVKEAQEHLQELLEAVSEGEEVIICQGGKAIARLVRVVEKPAFPDRTAFRRRITPAKTPAAAVVRALRDED